MKRTSIIDIDQFANSNLYNQRTRVHYNIWEDENITGYRWCDLKGKISYEKAKFILDTLYMTPDEYYDEHGEELDEDLAKAKMF